MTQLKNMTIGVLMGGPSGEREISLTSGRAVLQALQQAGYRAVPIEVPRGSFVQVSEATQRLLTMAKIDVAFIALHGPFGEDGTVQALLEYLGIPYTGSGVEASRLAMDKAASRERFAAAGLAVPPGCVVDADQWESVRRHGWDVGEWEAQLGFTLPDTLPWIIKPVRQGSSLGLSRAHHLREAAPAMELALRYDRRALIEAYVPGRELTVAVYDERPLCVIEIVPPEGLFDFEAKYRGAATQYLVPARLEPETAQRVQQAALAAHQALGMRSVSRTDCILDSAEQPVILEVNAIPGLTPRSLLPKAAAQGGLSFTQLCEGMLCHAAEKLLQPKPAIAAAW